MPLEVYSSDDALKIAHENKAYRSWPHRRVDARVEPVALPEFKPSFSLKPKEKIFTIGSCFARSIEEVLERLGFELVVRSLSSDERFIEADGRVHQLNKYNPYSILNELRWALEPDRVAYPDPGGFLELGEDHWLDANMHATHAMSLAKVRNRRRLALENAQRVRECRVVIMTPGLVESWWDRETASYINETPPISFMKKHPDRFQLHILSYGEVIGAFTDVHALLSRHLSPDFRILMSVSPVPLDTTFRSKDVMVANAYSKSVLRAAAEEFCERHANVDYFPSYESVVLSKREVAWDDDQIHPTEEIVGVNVCRMVERYLEAPDVAIISKLRKSLEQAKNLEADSVKWLKGDLGDAKRRIEKLEALVELQQKTLEMKDIELKQSQDTSARYLRQILERDGVLTPSE